TARSTSGWMPALQGFMVEWPLATPTIGLSKSPSAKPTARSIARFGERATPWVMSLERRFAGEEGFFRFCSAMSGSSDRVLCMAAGERGRLRIGFVSLADYGVLPGLLKAYKAARPGVALALREMLSPEQAAALAAGDLDFGLLLPPVSGAAVLEHVVVQRERFVVALPSRHRLAGGRGRLAVSALAGEAFVMVPREIAPRLYDIVTGIAARAGFSLN